jgi:putative component of membrane protein insertase Oxa1/YidC/SpoIIIJ protein YidD
MRKLLFCLFLFGSLGAKTAFAQTAEDIKSFQNLENANVEHYTPKLSLQGKSAEGMLFSSMFYIYKRFFSSQDGNQCQFSPSCSEYAWQSVKKKGPIMGMIDGFDRLCRCNGMSRELYHKDPNSNRLYDPVD